MKLVHNNTLISKLSNCHLLLDANVFFHAVANDKFYNLLLDLHEAGCALLTIPSVVFEFARGAQSIKQFNWYVDFINSLGVATYKDVEALIMRDRAFSVLLQKYTKNGKKGVSYTDFLLMMLLHKFHHTADKIYLMTANYIDIPLTIFDRTDLIALEYQHGVQTQALYKNSSIKLQELIRAEV